MKKNKILLLGSGELGKEFVIAAQRLGQYVIAVDRYLGAPAMHVADESFAIDMQNEEQLAQIIADHSPDYIVPEIEAINTEFLKKIEQLGAVVVPSANAVNLTMDRKGIRKLASETLGIRTSKFAFASSLEELQSASHSVGFPAVIKPTMSSSGKGQSTVHSYDELSTAWEKAINESRGKSAEVIMEEFIHFSSEITLLTISQKNSEVLFCPPIGHTQRSGDYVESWQPHPMSEEFLYQAQQMAKTVVTALTGFGIWGVEFFLTESEVVFSELSPRPHDTGMVTLAGTQTLNEFELHLRAILGLPIPKIELIRKGASAVVLANETSDYEPSFTNIEKALEIPNSSLFIFKKPSTRKNRRMAVAVVHEGSNENNEIESLVKKANEVASLVKLEYKK